MSQVPRVRALPRSTGFLDQIDELRRPGQEPDTELVLVGTSDPLAPPWQNGWGNAGGMFAPVGFYLSADGEVRFVGHMAGGQPGTVAFQLPVGFRPEHSEVFIVPGVENGYSVLQIDNNGDVKVLRTVVQ